MEKSFSSAQEGFGYFLTKLISVGFVCKRFSKNKLAMLGLFLVIILVFLALSADLFFDYHDDAVLQDIRNRLQRPGENMEHILGTDQYGRDMLARIIYGARVSLAISVAVISISTVLGIIIGGLAAFYGGIVDNVIMRINDIFYSIPFTLMAISIVASLGGGIPNLVMACTIGVVPGFARIFRSAIMPIKTQEFIEAAKASGSSELRIFVKHIVPNALGQIIVQATLHLASTILAISGLSYIGLGIESPTPEWGAMLSEARNHMREYPYLVVVPGIAIRLEWSGGINADSKVAVLFSGFPEYGKEQHTGREKEVQRIDCCQ